MKIFYDKEKSMELMKKIEDKFGEENKKNVRGEECHVSDIVGCEVMAYCRITGVPRYTTKQQIGMMVFGIIAENVLAWTYPKDVSQWESNLPLVEKDENIFGHIDIFELKKFVLEVKASRKRIFKAEDVPERWVRQIISYMAMEGSNKGWIVVFNIISCIIMAFRIVLTQDDIIGWLINMAQKRTNIRISCDTKDPSSLKIFPEERSWCDYKKDCPKTSECKRLAKNLTKKPRKKSPLE